MVIDLLWLRDDDGDQIDGSIRTTQFLSCVFSHDNWTQDIYGVGKYCVDTYLPLDEWNDIIVEIHEEKGNEIYRQIQERTQQLKESLNTTALPLVPWVTLNGHHSLRTGNDLLQTVCELYTVIEKNVLIH